MEAILSQGRILKRKGEESLGWNKNGNGSYGVKEGYKVCFVEKKDLVQLKIWIKVWNPMIWLKVTYFSSLEIF
jgi:hypothetical protein